MREITEKYRIENSESLFVGQSRFKERMRQIWKKFLGEICIQFEVHVSQRSWGLFPGPTIFWCSNNIVGLVTLVTTESSNKGMADTGDYQRLDEENKKVTKGEGRRDWYVQWKPIYVSSKYHSNIAPPGFCYAEPLGKQ